MKYIVLLSLTISSFSYAMHKVTSNTQRAYVARLFSTSLNWSEIKKLEQKRAITKNDAGRLRLAAIKYQNLSLKQIESQIENLQNELTSGEEALKQEKLKLLHDLEEEKLCFRHD